MAHINQTAVGSPLDFVQLARAHLMNRCDITKLRRPQLRPAPDAMPKSLNQEAPPWRPPHELTARLSLSAVNILRMRRNEN